MNLALLLAAVPFPARPQDAPAEASAAGPWKPVDWVEVQAGDRLITWSDVEQTTLRETERRKVSLTTPAERGRAYAQTLDELVLMALEAQAAEDHEESPSDAQSKVDRYLKSRRKQASLVEYEEQLEASGISAQAEHERTMSDYYTSTFRSQGLYGPRPTRDGYIRPGEVRELYRIQGGELGGDPSFRFQDLLVTAEQVGGVEPARALAEELRQRLIDGEDFKTLHEEYGTTELDTSGVTRLFGPENPLPDPVLKRFGEESEVGSISAVLPVKDPRRPTEVVGFRVLRLYERTPGTPPPPFGEAETQALIRKEAGRNRDSIWLGVARARLTASAFVWSKGAEDAGPEAGAAPSASSP